jgi:DNA polymerase I-like protein with 3'-5' exonuclease and polymerase domains/uracil-DNA glycosylase
MVVVGDAPDDTDVKQGRPFTSSDNALLHNQLGKLGIKRENVLFTNAVLCQPPANDMKRLLARIKSQNNEIRRHNKKAANTGSPLKPYLMTPQECCRPRLYNDIKGFKNILTLGNTACRAVTGAAASILDLRGGMMEGPLHYDPEHNKLTLLKTDAHTELTGTPVKVMPSLSPDFIRYAKKWTGPFMADVARAVKWFKDALAWTRPELIFQPEPQELYDFLETLDPIVYDLETDGIEPTIAKIRCIGLGNTEKVMVVGLLSKDGETRFYDPIREFLILCVIRDAIRSGKLFVGHNSGSYDRTVMQHQIHTRAADLMAELGLGEEYWPDVHEPVDPKNNLDTLLLHRLVASELPHKLGFVASIYTNAPSWKTDREGRKLAWDSETDEELHEYNGLDVAQTARIVAPLMEAVHARNQQQLIENDHAIQDICVGMHNVGMYVDQELRLKLEKKKLQEVVELRRKLQACAGDTSLNPGSTHQLRHLFFKDWRLQPRLADKERYTLSGDPSTSDDVVRACLALRSLTPAQRIFMKTLRLYRSAQKELGTYIVKLRFRNEIANIGWDDDIEENGLSEDEVSLYDEMEELYEKKGYERRGIVWPDGRMRPGYNAAVAVTGRLSSSKPINAQNFPKALRKMIRAQKGHILVGADADQLELRIAASRWKCPLYLGAFAADADPHSMTALSCFGEDFAKAAGWPEGERIQIGRFLVPRNGAKFASGSMAERMRKLAKIVQYLSQYGGSPEAGLRALQQTEDDDGELVYLMFSLAEYVKLHTGWLQGAKEFPVGWDKEILFYRKNGFIREDVMGRRRDCLNGEEFNEIVNFPIQASAAALINRAMIKIYKAIPLHKWGPGTGLLTQTHDALVIECPDTGVEERINPKTGKKYLWAPPGSPAREAADCIEDAMNQTDPSLPGVAFTASADLEYTWDKVG